MNFPPPPPPRPRAPSSPDFDGLTGRFEAIEHRLEVTVARVDSKVDGLSAKVGELAVQVAVGQAAARSDTTKQIVALVIAMLGAVGGSRIIAPAQPVPEAPRPSMYDRAVEECRKLTDEEAKGRCILRVTTEAAGPIR